MVTLNKSTTVTGVSIIDTNEGKVQVAFMNANIPSDGKLSQSRAIQNKQAFEENKSEVLKDFAAFDEYVYNLVPQVSEDFDQAD